MRKLTESQERLLKAIDKAIRDGKCRVELTKVAPINVNEHIKESRVYGRAIASFEANGNNSLCGVISVDVTVTYRYGLDWGGLPLIYREVNPGFVEGDKLEPSLDISSSQLHYVGFHGRASVLWLNNRLQNIDGYTYMLNILRCLNHQYTSLELVYTSAMELDRKTTRVNYLVNDSVVSKHVSIDVEKPMEELFWKGRIVSVDSPIKELGWFNRAVPRGVLSSDYELVAIPEAKQMFSQWKEEHTSPFDLDEAEGDE